MKMGLIFKKVSENTVEVERATRESEIVVKIDCGSRREFNIETKIPFFNHMIETIAWRACMNIDVNVKTNSKLEHLITEDVGIVLGQALRKLYEAKIKTGVNGAGYAFSVIDESLSLAVISIEGRANTFINLGGKNLNLKNVEGMVGANLQAFIEGLSQGLGATIQIDVFDGQDPHHLWESIFRALGTAIKEAFAKNDFRKGTTAGVKGTLE